MKRMESTILNYLVAVGLISSITVLFGIVMPNIKYEIYYETTIPLNPPHGTTHISVILREVDISPQPTKEPTLIDEGKIKPLTGRHLTLTIFIDKDLDNRLFPVGVSERHGFITIEVIYYHQVAVAYLELKREVYVIPITT